MTLKTQLIGRIAFGISSLLTAANSPIAKAQLPENAPNQSPTPNILLESNQDSKNVKPANEEKTRKEELRKLAIENRYALGVFYFVSNPDKYKVDENDVDFILGKKMILQDKQSGDLEFVDDNEENKKLAETQNRNIIRRDNSSYFNLGIGRNPTTIELIKSNVDLRKRVDEFILKDPNESFVTGLGLNEIDYPVTDEIQEFFRRNPDLPPVYYFAKDATWKINDTDRALVRGEDTFNSMLSRGVVRNNGYIEKGANDVPLEDKKISRNHPKSDIAAVLSNLDIWAFEEADMETAIKTLEGLDDIEVNNTTVLDETSLYVENIVKKVNRPLKPHEIEHVRNNTNSDLAQVARNPFYLKDRTPEDIKKDIVLALEKAGDGEFESSAFSEALFYNPALTLTAELISILISEPYINTTTSERMAQREDFPLTKDRLKIANENPDTSFAKGVHTHIAIKELNEVISKTKEIIGNIQGQNTSEQTKRIISEIERFIAQKDKVIEIALDQSSPSTMIHAYKNAIENAGKTIK